MAIHWDAATREWHLASGALSYALRVGEGGALLGLYAGAPIAAGRSYAHLGPRPFAGFDNRLGEPVRLEVPTPGSGDYRIPALVAEQADGATVLDLRYVGHAILAGKPALDGLPSTYAETDAEAETLEITLRDEHSGVEVVARYSIFAGRPVIARSMTVRNAGRNPVRLVTAMSATLDLPGSAFDLVTLGGTWARERHVVSRPLVPGRQGVASNRGESSHEQNPFLVLAGPGATETTGEAWGFSLVYSGNFLAEAEVEPFGTTRVRLGINPETFGWPLAPGQAFTTPEAVIAWSGEGLGGLTDAYHGLYRDRLARGTWRDRPRPVLLNNWEATYFDFGAPRIVEIARSARDLGVELFVLDDGWFGRRDSDHTSLGDWVVDRRKLPDGLGALAAQVEALGLGFGLWIEPEMVSRQSDLFAAHPDWTVGIPGRPLTEGRQQLILDMSRPEVVDHLFAVLADVLRSAPISYIKWDYNRHMTEPHSSALPPDRQGEFAHRHVLGTYELYRRLTEAFPDILFESCASGGGRFDPGLLAFAPQAWTSDNTDAVERVLIQWGSSLAYPQSSMGNHVSAVPNHQTGRITPLSFRGKVAFFGTFGYELDPGSLTDAERAEVAEQVAFYTEQRDVFQFGRFLRLRIPFEGDRNEAAWMVASPEADRAVVGAYRFLSRPMPTVNRLRLRGLDPARTYRVSLWPSGDDPLAAANVGLRGGDELMAAGLDLTLTKQQTQASHDFRAWIFVLEAT